MPSSYVNIVILISLLFVNHDATHSLLSLCKGWGVCGFCLFNIFIFYFGVYLSDWFACNRAIAIKKCQGILDSRLGFVILALLCRLQWIFRCIKQGNRVELYRNNINAYFLTKYLCSFNIYPYIQALYNTFVSPVRDRERSFPYGHIYIMSAQQRRLTTIVIITRTQRQHP